AADVEKLDLDAMSSKPFCHAEDFIQRLQERLDRQNLRADVAGDAPDLEVRRRRGAPVELDGLLFGDAELVNRLSGGNIRVGLGGYIRVDADGDPRGLSCSATPAGGSEPGATFNQLELARRLDVKHQDACFEARVHLRRSLAHAGEDDAVRIGSHLARPSELTAGHNVKPRARVAEDFENFQIGVRLDRVAEQARNVTQALRDAAKVIEDSRLAVDVGGCAVAFSDGPDRDVLAVKLARAIIKSLHTRPQLSGAIPHRLWVTLGVEYR